MKPTVIRLCYTKSYLNDGNFDQDITDGQVLTAKPHYSGIFELYVNSLLDIYFLPGFNYTMMSSTEEGKHDAGGKNFTGCNGLLQSNQADIGLYMYSYPSNDDSIDLTGVSAERSIVILSLYNMTSGGKTMDIMDSYKSLNVSVWCLFLLTCIILAFMMKTTTSRITLDTLAIVMIYLFRQSDLNTVTQRDFPRSLSTLLGFLIFLVSTVYVCLIKTDTVVIEKPFLIQSYDDIIANLHKLTPKFVYTHDPPDDFVHPRPGSKEEYIWKAIQGRNYIFDRNALPDFVNMKEGRACLIFDSREVQLTVSGYCMAHSMFTTQFGNTFPWVATDPSSRRVQYGYVFRKGISDDYRKLLIKKATRVTEHGISEYGEGATTMKMAIEVDQSQFRRCTSLKLQIPDVGHFPLNIFNYRYLFYWMLTLIYISLIPLWIEITFWRKTSKRKSLLQRLENLLL